MSHKIIQNEKWITHADSKVHKTDCIVIIIWTLKHNSSATFYTMATLGVLHNYSMSLEYIAEGQINNTTSLKQSSAQLQK